MRKKLAAIFREKHFYLFLPVLLCSVLALGQPAEQARIRGRVTDERGEAMPGVSILIKGVSTGVTTDANGNYSINASRGAVLIFKALNYRVEEIAIGNDPVINIQLKSIAKDLEEVIVSYGRQRSREVTGSIAQVSAIPLQDMPVGQFGQQLQGKLPGVDIQQTSGQPGRGIAFRIRGAASLAADYQPLFVIDGMPITGSINNINPSEIETFTVLKDASASALYGSRAANGVVLITTRHAKPGEFSVQFNSNYGLQKIPSNKVPRTMNANQFATFMNERYQDQVKYEGVTAPIDTTYANPGKYGAGTDWYSLLTRTAPVQSYDLIIQSGHEKSSSTLIAGYQSQDGVIVNTGTKLFSLRLNEDFRLSSDNKLKIGFNVAPSYRLDHNNRLATDGVGGLFERIFESSPLVGPYNPDGTYTKSVASPGMVAYINPLAQLKLNKDDYITTRILGNAYLNYEFLPGLLVKTNVGIDKGAETRNQFTPATITTTNTATGLASSVDNYSWTAEAMLQYDKTFWTDHHIEALVGYSAQKYNSVSNSVSGTGYPSDDISYLSAATSISAGASNTQQYSLLSTIARLNYNYKGRYMLQGAIRSDGSSRFGEDRKYGYFPSVSAGWMLSDESFMERVKGIDMLKLRASYGITGNNNIGNYTDLAILGQYNYILNGALASGETISTLGNNQLAWERNKQFDIGFDLSILHNRVNFTYDFYHKVSDGLIEARPIPRASGFATINYNIGNFEFWGHEFAVNTTNMTGKLQWTTNLNIAVDRNLIKALVSPGFIRRNNTVTSDYYRNQVGHHLGEFYGFIFEGLYKDSTDLATSARYGSASDVGTIKVKDINKDGVIDDVNDRTFIGDPTPYFTFGLTNSFKYKSFDFSVSMAGSVGGKILNAAKWAYLTNMDGSRVPLAAALDHWRSIQQPGSGVYPRTRTGTTALGREVNTQWIENGSFLTVKNITLGYTFGLKGNLMLKTLRMYLSVQQAFILTRYSGMNPEISLSGEDATQGIGVDENAYPVPRTFSFGISTTFK
ncbi:MAG TPA: TonB-dependent receptor [Chitinophagaceae bacterium]